MNSIKFDLFMHIWYSHNLAFPLFFRKLIFYSRYSEGVGGCTLNLALTKEAFNLNKARESDIENMQTKFLSFQIFYSPVRQSGANVITDWTCSISRYSSLVYYTKSVNFVCFAKLIIHIKKATVRRDINILYCRCPCVRMTVEFNGTWLTRCAVRAFDMCSKWK